MSDYPYRGPDELLLRLITHAPVEDQPALTRIFADADHISRHLPAYAVPGAIRAAWLCSIAATATEDQLPYAPALWRAARAYLDQATQPMLPIVTHAPDDASELDG
jgi:hypothetical protein